MAYPATRIIGDRYYLEYTGAKACQFALYHFGRPKDPSEQPFSRSRWAVNLFVGKSDADIARSLGFEKGKMANLPGLFSSLSQDLIGYMVFRQCLKRHYIFHVSQRYSDSLSRARLNNNNQIIVFILGTDKR
jgi:hypothetical protein